MGRRWEPGGSFRLPAESGALVLGAIERRLDRQVVADADADGARDPYSAVRADAHVELVQAGSCRREADGTPESPVLVTVVTEVGVLQSTESRRLQRFRRSGGRGDPHPPDNYLRRIWS